MHVMERDHFFYVRNVDGREKQHKLWSFCALSFLVWSVFMHCKVALLLFFMMCIGLYFWLYSSFLFLSSFCCIPFPCLTFLYNHNNNWVPLSWTKYSKTKRIETKENRANYIRTERVCSQITARTTTTIANDDDYQCMHEPRQLVSMQQYWTNKTEEEEEEKLDWEKKSVNTTMKNTWRRGWNHVHYLHLRIQKLNGFRCGCGCGCCRWYVIRWMHFSE